MTKSIESTVSETATSEKADKVKTFKAPLCFTAEGKIDVAASLASATEVLTELAGGKKKKAKAVQVSPEIENLVQAAFDANPAAVSLELFSSMCAATHNGGADFASVRKQVQEYIKSNTTSERSEGFRAKVGPKGGVQRWKDVVEAEATEVAEPASS